MTAEHLEYFAALGRLAAVALYHGETLPLRLTPAFCKRLLGRGFHSFPFPLNLSLLCPFPLNLILLCPPYNPTYPWMCPDGAQAEL